MAFKKKKPLDADPVRTDGNPAGTFGIKSERTPQEEKNAVLSDLELSGYTGAKIMAYLAEELAVLTQILNVLKEIRDDEN